MTNNQVIHAIKMEAAAVGLTFKVDNSKRLNGMTAYKFCIRKQTKIVLCNMTLSEAYTNTLSGYINSWNKQYERFDGVIDDNI